MKIIGKLNAEESSLLKLAQNKLEDMHRDHMEEMLKKKKVFWTNFYCAGQPECKFERQEKELLEKLLELMQAIVARYDLPKRLLAVNISTNPRDTKEQYPHIDYLGITASIFIPLTPVSIQNTIAYFEPELSIENKKRFYSVVGAKQAHAMMETIEKEIQPMTETRRGFEPFSLVYLPPGLIHRAVANRSSYDRKMMCVMLTDDPEYLLDEAETEQGI